MDVRVVIITGHMKPGAWIGKSWIPALHFVVGVLPCTYTVYQLQFFSIEKLSTHIAEEQLLFQPHVEPPVLKFPEYYLAYNKLSKQSRKVFYTAKMVNMAGNEFFDLER